MVLELNDLKLNDLIGGEVTYCRYPQDRDIILDIRQSGKGNVIKISFIHGELITASYYNNKIFTSLIQNIELSDRILIFKYPS